MAEVQYITDVHGNRTAVILPIEEYEAWLDQMEEIDDPELVEAMSEAEDSPRVPRELLTDLLEKQT